MSQFGGHYSGRGGFEVGLLILLLLFLVGSVPSALRWVDAHLPDPLGHADSVARPEKNLIDEAFRPFTPEEQRESDAEFARWQRQQKENEGRAQEQQVLAEREQKRQDALRAKVCRQLQASSDRLARELRPVLESHVARDVMWEANRKVRELTGGSTEAAVRSGDMRSSR